MALFRTTTESRRPVPAAKQAERGRVQPGDDSGLATSPAYTSPWAMDSLPRKASRW